MEFITIEIGDDNYPPLLTEIPNPPRRIYLRGAVPDTRTPSVAIVGTRKATAAGIGIAEKLAAELSVRGITIVSGLAMGIDAAAHRGALSARGKTIAVLGNGINEIYPAQHERLAAELLEGGGAIISEYAPGEPSFKGNFIQRNRIISGLSVAVVVVEAPERSGALATAGFAAEQGRNVFVVPGPTTHPNYVGSHSLIRDGAVLVASAADILEDIGILEESIKPREASVSLNLDINESLILEAIKSAGQPLEVDRIAPIANLTPQAVNQALTSLLLKGLIKEFSGKYEASYS